MQRKFLFIIGIVGLIILIVVLFRYVILGRSARQGVLKVSSNTAARVLLDNRDIGKTPLEQKVNVGEYDIRLIPESSSTPLSSWQGRVTIGGNTLTYVNRDLAESELTSAGDQLWLEKITNNKAELSILSTPDGANVLVNDQSRGVTPLALTDIAEGDHTVVVNSPGFDPRTIKVKLTAGYRAIVSLSLALSPSQIAQPTLFTALDTTPSAMLSVQTSITPSSKPSPTAIVVKPSPTQAVSSGAKEIRILETPTGFLRVRKEPSTASEELGRVLPGEEFTVLKEQGTWYQIPFKDNQGWISAQYAEKVE